MKRQITHVFYQRSHKEELHFNVETNGPLTNSETGILLWLIREPGTDYVPKFEPMLSGEIVEIGPLMNFETTFSSKATSICQKAGLEKVTRIEYFTRYLVPEGVDRAEFISAHCDRMTEGVYDSLLASFESEIAPAATETFDLIGKGMAELERVNKALGLAFSKSKLDFIYRYFTEYERRNPTDVELFMAGQALSEHCRHGFFGARIYIDGILQTKTLFQILKETLAANPGNSNSAFRDDASSIVGYEVPILQPNYPFTTSPFVERRRLCHLNNTAETHNYPTSIEPFAGAITGIIGEQRDQMAQGRGSQGILVYGGYHVAGLNMPGYYIPGEKNLPLSPRLATPLEILIKGSNGMVDGGNKYGQPVTGGICRSVDLILPDGERRGYVKPILYVGGVGFVFDEHLNKEEPQVGMKIVQIGGPAFRVGFGGGSRSSDLSTTQKEYELDYSGVQRGDPETQNGVYRVNRACVEMGDNNPIACVHDQGAGGPGNVLLEIVGRAGGNIDVRKIRVGDKTMSVMEIIGAEHQERMAYLILAERFEIFKQICQREGVYYEELGEITGDGRIVFEDSADNSTPVNLDLKKFMVDLPQEEYRLERVDHGLVPLVIPKNLTVNDAFARVCKQLSVCSKGFLIHKGDQSVGGLVARQQCCGPMMIPVSDVSVGAISHLAMAGVAQALGESPLKMLVNPTVGTRMVIAEALTNISAAAISAIEDIAYRANWMVAAKLPGEGAVICEAIVSLHDLSIRFKIKPDGGKDSLTMAEFIEGKFIKSPATLVLSAYTSVPDISKVATPDIKLPGKSVLILLDPARGKNRLGGSALAQSLDGQIGNECPDIDDPDIFLETLRAVQALHREELLLSYHDRTGDGGLIITLAEMAMSSNCGLVASLDLPEGTRAIEHLFAEEAGMVIECASDRAKAACEIIEQYGVPYEVLGMTQEKPRVIIQAEGKIVFDMPTGEIRRMWEQTSFEIEKRQTPNPECAEEEYGHYETMVAPKCALTFEPKPTPVAIMSAGSKPKVAVLRTHGTNSDREMANAFYLAGFEAHDVNMDDLQKGRVTLDSFRGLASAGGFADADVFGSAKGWAAAVQLDPWLKEMFERFYRRPDTFSYHECNGCQWALHLGWLPSIDMPEKDQPRMVRNVSGRFEHRWPMLKIGWSPSIMFSGMEGSRLVIPSAHGEGRFYFPNSAVLADILENNLAPVSYIDDMGNPTEKYPYNPNGSPYGIAALCSADGRHLAMMPHSTRVFLKWQLPWLPQEWKNLFASPWLKMFQNARIWCEENQ